MENNNQNELQQEEIPNIEQFKVGRVPSEDEDLQNGPQDNATDDDVELGFTEDEPEDGTDPLDDEDDEGDQDEEYDQDYDADDDEDFESPDDDPA